MSEEKEVRRPGVWEEMFPGRFLKATATGVMMSLRSGGPPKVYPYVTLMISDVTLEEMPTDKGGEQTRGIISFKQTPMQLAINKTNGVCLRAMFGNRPAEWVGKRITLVPEKDRFGRETVDAIRVKGSPDLKEPIDVEIRMPRKKPKTRQLVPTVVNGNNGNGQQRQQQRAPEPEHLPPPSDDDGAVPPDQEPKFQDDIPF